MTAQPILFYSTKEKYGPFSNFSRHAIELDGKVWPTSEHYFQAQKFAPNEDLMERVRQAPGPSEAAALGRDRSLPLRADWEEVKEEVMRRVLVAKFTQHPEAGALLIGTGDAPLIEHTTKDRYWADGGDGTGKNRLGWLLMDVRTELTPRLARTARP